MGGLIYRFLGQRRASRRAGGIFHWDDKGPRYASLHAVRQVQVVCAPSNLVPFRCFGVLQGAGCSDWIRCRQVQDIGHIPGLFCEVSKHGLGGARTPRRICVWVYAPWVEEPKQLGVWARFLVWVNLPLWGTVCCGSTRVALLAVMLLDGDERLALRACLARKHA